MDPGNIPFNALIVGPTNSSKTQFLVNQLCSPFCFLSDDCAVSKDVKGGPGSW